MINDFDWEVEVVRSNVSSGSCLIGMRMCRDGSTFSDRDLAFCGNRNAALTTKCARNKLVPAERNDIEVNVRINQVSGCCYGVMMSFAGCGNGSGKLL